MKKKIFSEDDQTKAYEYFSEKRKREEEDSRLAKELAEMEEKQSKSPVKPVSAAGDLDLAIKLIAQENEERNKKKFWNKLNVMQL